MTNFQLVWAALVSILSTELGKTLVAGLFGGLTAAIITLIINKTEQRKKLTVEISLKILEHNRAFSERNGEFLKIINYSSESNNKISESKDLKKKIGIFREGIRQLIPFFNILELSCMLYAKNELNRKYFDDFLNELIGDWQTVKNVVFSDDVLFKKVGLARTSYEWKSFEKYEISKSSLENILDLFRKTHK